MKLAILKSFARPIAIAIILITGVSVLAAVTLTGTKVKNGALVIPKAAITSKATFYPIVVDGVKMEVFAVLADDGTIRTALNTCQVCNNSGRGWYVQEGDEMVCQNCGNRFNINKIELIKNGCNPIPITKDLKTETKATITINADVLASGEQVSGIAFQQTGEPR